MKRQNGVILSGVLVHLDPQTVRKGDVSGRVLRATLVTDHPAYGGHHQILFLDDWVDETLAFSDLAEQPLEVTIEGWLRSSRQETVVVVDRVIYLNVTQAMRDEVARLKAQQRARAGASPAAAPGAARRPNGGGATRRPPHA